MPHKTAFILSLLTLATLCGVGLALTARHEWVLWVFWGSANLIPVAFILLAWWGAQDQNSSKSAALEDVVGVVGDLDTYETTSSELNSRV